MTWLLRAIQTISVTSSFDAKPFKMNKINELTLTTAWKKYKKKVCRYFFLNKYYFNLSQEQSRAQKIKYITKGYGNSLSSVTETGNSSFKFKKKSLERKWKLSKRMLFIILCKCSKFHKIIIYFCLGFSPSNQSL